MIKKPSPYRYFDNRFETIDENGLLALQTRRLKSVVSYVTRNSLFYKQLFKKYKIKPSMIRNLQDIEKLPFTNLEDVRKFNWKFVTKEKASQIFCSGGTTGKPKIFFCSSNDLRFMFERSARSFVACGVMESDVVAVLQPFGIWALGYDYIQALNMVGATVLPLGINLEDIDSAKLMKTLKVTVVLVAPGNFCRLTGFIKKHGFSLKKDFQIRIIITAGEKLTVQQRKFLENSWNADVFDLYGTSETGTLGGECIEKNGLHLWGDHFLFEVVDPKEENKIANGNEPGELVITTLTQHGTPLIRYRTRDIVKKTSKQCRCGRTHSLFEILGRIDESVALKEGTKVFSYQVENVLRHLSECTGNYRVVIEDHRGRDKLTFLIEVRKNKKNLFLKNKLSRLIGTLSIDFVDAVNSGIVLKPIIKLLSSLSVKSTKRGKLIKFIDKRRNIIKCEGI